MSVASSEIQATFCATFVDELLLGGVTDVVLCPGSRSTPLALACLKSSLTTHVRLDERSAAFFALGLSRSSGRPTLVVVTSGTAAAELHAGVLEASLDRVPLIIATADRPPELQQIGAPQTVNQAHLYGDAVRFTSLPGPCHAWPTEQWRSFSSRLVLEANGVAGLPGPVHVNLPFIEPLVTAPGELPPRRSGTQPWSQLAVSPSSSLDLGREVLALFEGRRGVFLVGDGGGSLETIRSTAQHLAWPVLADARSRCRSEDPVMVTSADGILRNKAVALTLAPEVVVLLGAPPASKVISQWITALAGQGVEIVVIGRDGPSRHPTSSPATFLLTSPEEALGVIATIGTPAPHEWLDSWINAEHAATRGIETVLSRAELSEPGVARVLCQELPDDSTLVVSSSMPIRDVEWFGGCRPRAQRLLANRGANGIDGVVSTAMGVASSRSGPVVALVGDLAFLHDVSALVDGVGENASLVVVVLDNDGGGIFSFLPQRGTLQEHDFETLFGTPRRVSPGEVARGFGIEVTVPSSLDELRSALGSLVGRQGLHVVHCVVPSRDANVALHAEIHAAIEKNVAESLGLG